MLRVQPNGARSWVFRFRRDGKPRRVTLGKPDAVKADQARAAALTFLANEKGGEPPFRRARRRFGIAAAVLLPIWLNTGTWPLGAHAMTATAFDTLKAARDLEAAGVEQHQAEAIAAAIRDGQGELATKADLAAGLAGLKVDMLKLAIGIVAANTALTVGLLKLVP